MLSSSQDFTLEELAALKPWRVFLEEQQEAKDVQETSMVEEEVDVMPMITAEEIEAMQKQAYDEAAEHGRAEGFAEGLEKGLAEGQEKGFAQGLEEGRAEAYAEAREEIEKLTSGFDALIQALEEPLSEVDEQVEHELVELSIALAKQLIRRELKAEPGQIVAVVREALTVLPSNARKIMLYLHPDDAELVRHALSLDEHSPRCKITEDPTLQKGGCRVSSESSFIDATVEKRLAAAIAKAFGDERVRSEAS